MDGVKDVLVSVSLYFLALVFIVAFWNHFRATTKVAIRRSKKYCENSSAINNIQKKVKDFTEEVSAELKPQTQNTPTPKNSEIPAKRAENLPTVLMRIAVETAPYFTSVLLLEKISDDENGAMCKEVVAFTLHLTDRILYSALGTNDRNLLMDNLIVGTDVLLFKANVPRIMDFYEERSVFYSKFGKLIEDHDEKPDGTLFFEFGKSFVTLYGDSNSKLLPMMSTQVATYAMMLFGLISDALIKEKIIQDNVKPELGTQTQSISTIDHFATNKQCDPDEGNDINEHIFTITCKNCEEENEIRLKTIYYFPNCISCQKPMFEKIDKKFKESVMRYVNENKQIINKIVYKKLFNVLTD